MEIARNSTERIKMWHFNPQLLIAQKFDEASLFQASRPNQCKFMTVDGQLRFSQISSSWASHLRTIRGVTQFHLQPDISEHTPS